MRKIYPFFLLFFLCFSNKMAAMEIVDESNGPLSIIYYPSCKETWDVTGHVCLRLKNYVISLVKNEDVETANKFDDIAKHARTHIGARPFYEIKLKATKQQIRAISQEATTFRSTNCSFAVHELLKKHDVVDTPYPFANSPFLSTMYLLAEQKMIGNNVEKVECYEGDNGILNGIYDLSGPTGECFAGVATFLFGMKMARIVVKLLK